MIKNKFVISFLGPDGSGKSTIINEIIKNQNLFKTVDYFHLKPLKVRDLKNKVDNPHSSTSYSKTKSYLKILFFIAQYNIGWIKNIAPLKFSLVIFDRYFDDILVDPKRYRYGGHLMFIKLVRRFIPKPNIYFILTADPEIIFARKKEVTFKELERQVKEYRELGNNIDYINVNVNCSPKEITNEIISIIKKRSLM